MRVVAGMELLVASLDAILDVFLLRAAHEMVRVAAALVVAGMANHMALGDRPFGQVKG